MNLKSKALEGKTSKEMKCVAKQESLSTEFVRKGIANGSIVIPLNKRHENVKPIGIGRKLKTKINVNLGTSPKKASLREELEKLRVSVKFGADTVMDLSTGGNINKIREKILKHSFLPVGTVPIYQLMVESNMSYKTTIDDFLKVIEFQARQGVDFMTVHAGVRKKFLPLLKNRVAGVVSRGGSYLVKWMQKNRKENPLFEYFDEVLRIARKYDVTLSLGDGLRPGAIHDSTDKAQIAELKTLGELTKKAWSENVQVIVEGPGHVPLNEIKKNMELQQKHCFNAPFYVLGPIVTDIAPGYDHITSAIGGALAAFYGASFLCYVTPAEHLRLPSVEDVIEGVIASRIAAHSADIAKGIESEKNWDLELSKARKNLDWRKQFSMVLDPVKAKKYRKDSRIKENVCTMCGRFCALKDF